MVRYGSCASGGQTSVSAAELAPPPHERIVLNASFLVDSSRLTEFDAAVEQVGESQGGRMRFKYTGPLPPHSFVELTGAA